MFEKVNPMHPDKLADRIAGALVDLAYSKFSNPTVAIEVLIGHNICSIIVEASDKFFTTEEVNNIVNRIAGYIKHINIYYFPQDSILRNNQSDIIRCGDNGIFKGMPVTTEQWTLTNTVKALYETYPYDGKFIIDKTTCIACQSNAPREELEEWFKKEPYSTVAINPLGDWTGGTDVDTGATNRKLGSDMGDSVTGGGLHGKDLSKADVSVNIYAWLKAQETGKPVEFWCSIGQDRIDDKPYSEIVEIARKFINKIGGFEKFAEWGLIR